MSKIYNQYKRKGDKQNSPLFEDLLPQIYDRRESSGIDDLLEKMAAVIVQVESGDALSYISELYLMTPYRHQASFENSTHTIHVLQTKPDYPRFIVLEPKSKTYFDRFAALNYQYIRGKEKIQARYIGEIYKTKKLLETKSILQSQYIRFLEKSENNFFTNTQFAFTEPSYFTNNIVGYTESDFSQPEQLQLGEKISLPTDFTAQLQNVDLAYKNLGFDKLITGIDHLATRVFCNSREDALLEFLTVSNHYFWGAYNIEEMNSSTNVTRNPKIKDELLSPAKVFTANNTPYYSKSIDNLPAPTEDFVRNFGRRMHHIAVAVADGTHNSGLKNIDYVVSQLAENNIPFLAKVIGECKDFPDLKQIFSKSSPYSMLITEYVQRCHGFQGFFTKDNVAALTEAAGEDEKIKQADICD